jgi:hypothetical protein
MSPDQHEQIVASRAAAGLPPTPTDEEIERLAAIIARSYTIKAKATAHSSILVSR